MSDSLRNLAREIASGQSAYRAHEIALVRFRAALVAGDWPTIETARIEVIATLEAYLDALVAANKELRSEWPGTSTTS